ncbi:PREDICTED: uncharacterized protein LOC109334616 isoform X1 [Lupinus angustifolius]|uniref:uncharacterized protein LOC109334616 isoform X1 n=1 Tax=Lupinus angustifolius TaxID=3871 RepID=UPI00092FB307|nr:PREDICTED: uncharacterized protein LOC109334616 isoform X1 [Lupinus angustifolius]XP_019426031.1 PREDICTED: uncharacterized protein LOC109334616 isoform X1 [Lupinus angustifolius]
MSTPAVHLRSPINTSSVDSTSHFPPLPHQVPFPHFNADNLTSSATAATTARTRSKPRLTKLRKQSTKSRTRTTDSGFNPFCSDQVTVSDDISRKFGDTGFVFSASVPARDLNSEQEEASTIVKETEVRKCGGVEFVFSAKPSVKESNSRGNEAITVSGEGEVNIRGFVFNANGSNLVSEKGKSSEFVENSVGESKSGAKVEPEKLNCLNFVFGDNHSGKASKINVEKQESIGGMRYSDCVTGTNTVAHQNGYLGNDDIGKVKSAFGSSHGSPTAYSAFPSYKLTDEMKKLNIDRSQDDTNRDSTNAHVSSSFGFVFGGSEKAFGDFNVTSGSISNDQESRTNAASENIGGKLFKKCEANNVQNETGCGIAYGSIGTPCSKPSSNKGKIPVPEVSQVNGTAAPLSSSSFGLNSIQNNYASTDHPLNEDHNTRKDCFTSTPDASKESFMDFKPPTWSPDCFKENLFPELNRKSESTQKGKSCKEKGSKYMRRKSRPHSLNKKPTRLDHLSKENNSLESPDCSASYSPMDFSPYQETGADDQDVKASKDLNDLHPKFPIGCEDEHLAAANRRVDTNTADQRCGDPDNDKLLSRNGSSSVGDSHSSGPEIVLPSLETHQFSSSSLSGASADAGIDFSSNTEKQKPDHFVHHLGDSKETDFAFSASTAEDTSSFKGKQKKYRRRKGRDSFVICPNMNGKFESSVQFSPLTPANISSQSDGMDRSRMNDQIKEGGIAYSSTIHEACDKWRLRGNQAYKDGGLSEAEDFYTLGINSVPSTERSGCLIKPLLLCYSNRAATRMRLGRIREALGDCGLAIALDPTFQKAKMRIANCHLLLGEVENAQQCFNKCMESGSVVCLDRRVIVEAAEGLHKAQKVAECISSAAELLKKRTSDAAGTALELLTTALSISPSSEKMLQMKAEALYLLQKYDAAIQLCESSQHLAEKNFVSLPNSGSSSNISMRDNYSSVNLWRWSLISKCYFHLGKLEASLKVLEKLQQVVSVNDRCVIGNVGDPLSLAATIRELLDHKNAGNENFKLGKYKEAVENYTVALSSNIKSRPFAAICFCNRAAAHQALGQIADSIADCSMAMAISRNYAKAISRRATLHEKVRDYEQAACDLRKLISVFESQSDEKAKPSDSPSGSNGVKESRQAHQRLLSVEDQAKKKTLLDFYLILGTKPADTASDIKKAYHKAALRHHPDKAGQWLPRSEVGDEGKVWKEISQEVHKDADRLFKMIGEAYAVLSDPAKRSEYDLEEEIKKASQSSQGGTCRRSSDFYRYERSSDGYKSPSDKTSSRRYYGRDQWKTYGNSYSRW